MRFDKLSLGQKFAHGVNAARVSLFMKKSKSSAYVLDPINLEPIHLTVTFSRCDKRGSILGFSEAVQVHPLL